jgi:D-glycero-beta-D-manno-heptose 1-phosphate adenylyltransferase
MNILFTKPTSDELLISTSNKPLDVSPHSKVDYAKKVCIKPWGHEFLVFENSKTALWCLTLKKDSSTSLHCHYKKDTLLVVLSGCIKVGFHDGSFVSLSQMKSIYIPKQKFHSIGSFAPESSVLEMEIFCDDLSFTDKNDLLRIDDPYRRNPFGYESSVNIKTDSLDHFGYFSFPEKTIHRHKTIDLVYQRLTSTSLRTYYPTKPASYSILLEGQVRHKSHLLKEGSVLDPSYSYDLLSSSISVLTLSSIDSSDDEKILYDFQQLKQVSDTLQKEGKQIILTSGCFDILHVGHIETLKKARSLGDVLFVALSSDAQIQALKGAARPVNNYEDRKNLFKTIKYVDYIILYDEEDIEKEKTLDDIMKIVNPSVWVKGSDYTKDGILAKHPHLRSIELVPFVEHKSTTNIVNKILQK